MYIWPGGFLWSAHGLVGAGVGLGMSGKRGGLSVGGGGGRSWGARTGLVSGLTNSVQNPCVKRRGLCGESWLGLGSGGGGGGGGGGECCTGPKTYSAVPSHCLLGGRSRWGPCIEGGGGGGGGVRGNPP